MSEVELLEDGDFEAESWTIIDLGYDVQGVSYITDPSHVISGAKSLSCLSRNAPGPTLFGGEARKNVDGFIIGVEHRLRGKWHSEQTGGSNVGTVGVFLSDVLLFTFDSIQSTTVDFEIVFVPTVANGALQFRVIPPGVQGGRHFVFDGLSLTYEAAITDGIWRPTSPPTVDAFVKQENPNDAWTPVAPPSGVWSKV